MFDGRTANLNGDSEDFFKRLGPNSISAIKNLLASSIHDKTIETALGYIIASEKAETFAEEWRFSIQHAIYEGKNNLDFELIDSKIRTLSGNDNDKYEQLKTDLLRILSSKDKYGLHSEDTSVPDELWNFEAPLADIDSLLEAAANIDIEGLYMKTIETISLLEDPHPSNAASGWRDAQELLSFYAPLMFILGFNTLANDAYSRAYMFLHNRGTLKPIDKIASTAESINQRAKRFLEDDLSAGIGNSNLYHSLHEAIGELGDVPDFWALNNILLRPKSRGRTIQKLKRKRQDREIGMVPDGVGIYVCLPDNTIGKNASPHIKRLQLFENSVKIAQAIEKKYEGRIVAGNTRPDDPVIEITYEKSEWPDGAEVIKHYKDMLSRYYPNIDFQILFKDGEVIINKIDQGGILSPFAAIGKERKFLYSASHISFKIKDQDPETGEEYIPELGMEVKVAPSEEDYIRNEMKEGNHIWYVGEESFGEFGKLLRDNREEKVLSEELVTHLKSKIEFMKKYIFDRAADFIRDPRKEELKDSTQKEAAALLAEIRKVA
jgi:hypothetical protein